MNFTNFKFSGNFTEKKYVKVPTFFSWQYLFGENTLFVWETIAQNIFYNVLLMCKQNSFQFRYKNTFIIAKIIYSTVGPKFLQKYFCPTSNSRAWWETRTGTALPAPLSSLLGSGKWKPRDMANTGKSSCLVGIPDREWSLFGHHGNRERLRFGNVTGTLSEAIRLKYSQVKWRLRSVMLRFVVVQWISLCARPNCAVCYIINTCGKHWLRRRRRILVSVTLVPLWGLGTK